MGALQLKLVFDSSFNDRAYLNDSFLRWLRDNRARIGVGYTF